MGTTTAAVVRTPALTGRRWLLLTALSVLLLVALNVAIMVSTDTYCLFRSPAGRKVSIYYADRTAKSLLNLRYVHANFDALVVGPSSGVNWDMQEIGSGLNVRLYNESLEGGSSTEEKILVDHALEHGHYKLALVVLAPAMINGHAIVEGMDKVSPAEALGSLDAYIQTGVAAIHNSGRALRNLDATPDGSHQMRNPHGFDPARQERFSVDPVGLRTLQQIVGELRARGTAIVYVVPPVYQPFLDANAQTFARVSQTLAQNLPAAPLIDLNGPDLAALRADPANFIDEVHVDPAGAQTVSLYINQRLRQLEPQLLSTPKPPAP